MALRFEPSRFFLKGKVFSLMFILTFCGALYYFVMTCVRLVTGNLGGSMQDIQQMLSEYSRSKSL